MSTENLLQQDTHFAFGKNWLDYAEKIDATKIEHAMDDLRRLNGGDNLEGKSFLDIGCGSGLHALAAVRLGATRVQGVDIDENSVAASKRTLARFEPNAPAAFEIRSVFDMNADEYDSYDIVYSWGVLHHTGDMVGAITSAASLVNLGGEFLIALYKKTQFCGMWRVIKRWYSRTSPSNQRRAMRLYIAIRRLIHTVCGVDHAAYVRDYESSRGMNFQNDVHDWLGGYPYESISPEECRGLMSDLGFEVVREFIQTPGRFLRGLMGSGCDEYVFRRKVSPEGG